MRIINIEDVKVNNVALVKHTCLTRNETWKWSSMQADKKSIKENTVTYLIEVNNSYKKEVTFRFISITDKITDLNDIRKTYKEVVMEDIDGEFGKIICTTNEVRNATQSLKNKLTNEYRKTLKKIEKETKSLREQNEKLNNGLNEQKTINEKFSRINYVLNNEKAVLENKNEILEDENNELKNKNEVLVIKNKELKNELAIVSEFKNKFNKLGHLFFRVLLRKAITMYNSGKTIDEVVDYVMEKFNNELNNKN